MDRRGYVKLGDFEEARWFDEIEPRKKAHQRNSKYSAPEIMEIEGKYDFKVDYYSLGVILHELIYSCRPLRTGNKEDLYFPPTLWSGAGLSFLRDLL